MGDNSWIPAVLLIISSPAILLTLAFTGIGALYAMLSIVVNPLFLAANIVFVAIFYYADRLSVKTIGFSSLLVGFVFWVLALQKIFAIPLLFGATVGSVCGIPLIGGLFCGGIAVVTIGDLIGYVLAGFVVSAFAGGFVMLLKGKK